MWGRLRRRATLIDYLKDVKKNRPLGPNEAGQRSTLHLIARLGMTEEQVYRAARDARKQIYLALATEKERESRIAQDVLFEYDPQKARAQK